MRAVCGMRYTKTILTASPFKAYTYTYIYLHYSKTCRNGCQQWIIQCSPVWIISFIYNWLQFKISNTNIITHKYTNTHTHIQYNNNLTEFEYILNMLELVRCVCCIILFSEFPYWFHFNGTKRTKEFGNILV